MYSSFLKWVDLKDLYFLGENDSVFDTAKRTIIAFLIGSSPNRLQFVSHTAEPGIVRNIVRRT